MKEIYRESKSWKFFKVCGKESYISFVYIFRIIIVDKKLSVYMDHLCPTLRKRQSACFETAKQMMLLLRDRKEAGHKSQPQKKDRNNLTCHFFYKYIYILLEMLLVTHIYPTSPPNPVLLHWHGQIKARTLVIFG